jgi:hypothetical protein
MDMIININIMIVIAMFIIKVNFRIVIIIV